MILEIKQIIVTIKTFKWLFQIDNICLNYLKWITCLYHLDVFMSNIGRITNSSTFRAFIAILFNFLFRIIKRYPLLIKNIHCLFQAHMEVNSNMATRKYLL